jgi:hypothetical protein
MDASALALIYGMNGWELVPDQKTGELSLFLPPADYPSKPGIKEAADGFRKKFPGKLQPCMVKGFAGHSISIDLLQAEMQQHMEKNEPGLVKELREASYPKQ